MHKMNNKVFVPICLYRDGFFLDKENLRYFLHSFTDFSEIVFLIVDSLYANDLIIKDKAKDDIEAKFIANKRGQELLVYVENVTTSFVKRSNKISKRYKIVRWDDFASLGQYKNLYNKFSTEIKNDIEFMSYCDEFVMYNLKKLTTSISQHKIELEREYLFGEIVMSIYISELLGFGTTIWEKTPHPEMIDPINILYSKKSDLLFRILQTKNYLRKQIYLNEIFDIEFKSKK